MLVAFSTDARELLARLYELAQETRDCHSESINTLCCMGLASLWKDKRTNKEYVHITGSGVRYIERATP